jgi:ribonuclease J
VDILLIDSTNIENAGHSENEKSIIGNISDIIGNASGRVIATGFSSNTVRINNIIDISHKKGRTVGLLGRSVNSYTRIAAELGHIKLPESVLTEQSKINKVPENKLTLIVTGSQAEPRSVMKRMSLDMMKSVSIRYGDTIIFTSKNIPGNEISIGRMIDNLVEKGADVYYENTDRIHVSGHAKQFDIVQAFYDIDPALIIPVHGHRRFLELSSKLADKNGFNSQVISDGEMLVFRKKKKSVVSHKFDLTVKVVSNGDPDMVDIENIRERKKVAKAGIMTVMMTVDFLSNTLLSKPRIVSVGIASSAKMRKIDREIKDMIESYFKDELPEEPFWKDIEEELRIRVRRHLLAILKKKPIVNAIIVNLN